MKKEVVSSEASRHSYSSPQLDRNGLRRETYKLGLEAIQLARLLTKQHQYELNSQLLRSGTAPGALVAEYFYAESHRDSIHKLKIALKEANENRYWTSLCRDADLLPTVRANRHLKHLASVTRVLELFVQKHAPHAKPRRKSHR